MKATTDQLAYDQIKIAANCLDNVICSEVFEFDALLEHFAAALTIRLDKIKKSRSLVAHKQLAELKACIENGRAP